MNEQEAMDFITATYKFGRNYGLSRMKCMLAYLGNPHQNLKVIHVAGTNGKGSTCATLTSLLMAQGFSVGLYTSPFIEAFTERIQLNRQNIPMSELIECTEKVKEAVDHCVAQGLEHPTQFEIITTIMFLYFAQKKPDYCVVEVGLGGERDSTNVVEPLVAAIASISFDHMDVLGNSLKEISMAKAGIIKKDTPTVTVRQDREAQEVIEERARSLNSPLTVVSPEMVHYEGFIEEEACQMITYDLPLGQITAKYPLLGVHQWMNSLLALNAFLIAMKAEGVEVSPETLAKGLAQVHWMGRLERMSQKPLVLLDGAHNTDGITVLKKSLDFYYPKKDYILILGILADKETHKMADIIARQAKAVICVTPHSERASLAKDLYDYIKTFNPNSSYEEDYETALNKALELADEDTLIIASGSLYMVGDMRPIMRHKFWK